jgi:hypothetical protein
MVSAFIPPCLPSPTDREPSGAGWVACKLGLEGIVSKRLGSPYRSGRSRDWLR